MEIAAIAMQISFAIIDEITPVILLLITMIFYYKKRDINILIIIIGVVFIILGEVIIFIAPVEAAGVANETQRFHIISEYLFLSKVLSSLGMVISLLGLVFLAKKA